MVIGESRWNCQSKQPLFVECLGNSIMLGCSYQGQPVQLEELQPTAIFASKTSNKRKQYKSANIWPRGKPLINEEDGIMPLSEPQPDLLLGGFFSRTKPE